MAASRKRSRLATAATAAAAVGSGHLSQGLLFLLVQSQPLPLAAWVHVRPVQQRLWWGQRTTNAHRQATAMLALNPKIPGSEDSEVGSGAGFGSRNTRRKGLKRKAPPASSKGEERERARVEAVQPQVLKRSSEWACIKNCGACCFLKAEQRPDLADYLTEDEFELYKSMEQEDGWCKHFDKDKRACTIYEERPRFCRVTPFTFNDMFGVPVEDMDNFSTQCCREQIGEVYGGRSAELKAFNGAIRSLRKGDAPRPMPVDPFQGSDRQDLIMDWDEEWLREGGAPMVQEVDWEGEGEEEGEGEGEAADEADG